MALTEQILVRMGLDGTALDSGLRRSEGKVKQFAKAAKTALAGIGVAFGAASFIRGINSLRQFADDMSTRAKNIGVGAEFLQRFAYAAEQTGVESEKAQVALEKLVQKIGLANTVGGEYQKIFETFGINTRGKTMEQVLYDVSDAMAAMPDQFEKNALAMKLFEEGGAKLVATLGMGSSAMKKMMGEAVALGDAQIAQIDRLDKDLKRLGLQAKVFGGQGLSNYLQGGEIIKESGRLPQLASGLTGTLARFVVGGFFNKEFGGAAESERGAALDQQLAAINQMKNSAKQLEAEEKAARIAKQKEDRAERRERARETHLKRVEAHEKKMQQLADQRNQWLSRRMQLLSAYQGALGAQQQASGDRRRFSLGELLSLDPNEMSDAEFAQYQKGLDIADLERESKYAALVGDTKRAKSLDAEALAIRSGMEGLQSADRNPMRQYQERSAEALEALRGHVESGGLPVKPVMAE